jgi:hypothetical protein
MNFDTSLIDSKKAANKFEIDPSYIGVPLPTDKSVLAKKHDIGEKFGTKKVFTIVEITNIDDHKLHSMASNLSTNITQKVGQDDEIPVKTNKVELMDITPSSLPNYVTRVSATVQISHTKKSVVIRLKLYT